MSIETMGRYSGNPGWVLLLSLLLVVVFIVQLVKCRSIVLLVLLLNFDSRVGSDYLWEIVHDQGKSREEDGGSG